MTSSENQHRRGGRAPWRHRPRTIGSHVGATMIRIAHVLCPVDFSEIVMGAHGRGALELLAFGSTTHHVIRASACPVLIVRRS
jgi:nucleotide-binding universal stress UspA family protein